MVKGIDEVYFQLATLFDAGLPITRSLQTVAQGQKGRLKKTFTFLDDQVSCGSQIHEAMEKKRSIFAPLDITMVAAAEESGNLPATFKMLADWYDLQVKLRRKLIGGMAFPVFVLHLAIFLGPLPLLFLGRITVDHYLGNCFSILAWLWGIFIAVRLLLKLIPKRGVIRMPVDSFVLIIPLLRKPLFHLALSRFCRSFHMLYSSGIPIIDAARIALDQTGNGFVSRLLAGGSRSALSGRPMYKGFSRQLLPVELYSLWETGEESGTLDDTTIHLAKMYEERAIFGFQQFVFWLPKIVYAAVVIYEILLIARNFGYIYSHGAAI